VQFKPPRHWLAFRLRTLLFVMVPLCAAIAWVGFQVKWITDRHQFLSTLGPFDWAGYENPHDQALTRQNFPAPRRLRILGEHGVSAIYFLSEEIDRKKRAEELFPEATIYMCDSFQ
jgi:hypothetical protein